MPIEVNVVIKSLTIKKNLNFVTNNLLLCDRVNKQNNLLYYINKNTLYLLKQCMHNNFSSFTQLVVLMQA